MKYKTNRESTRAPVLITCLPFIVPNSNLTEIQETNKYIEKQ